MEALCIFINNIYIKNLTSKNILWRSVNLCVCSGLLPLGRTIDKSRTMARMERTLAVRSQSSPAIGLTSLDPAQPVKKETCVRTYLVLSMILSR